MKTKHYPEDLTKETVSVTLIMRKDYVSCITCDLCYTAGYAEQPPIFCQNLKLNINPRMIYENQERASRCLCYWPHGVTREARAGERDV